MEIRNARLEDAGAICEIYNYYITNTTITFEEQPVNETEMRDRICKVQDRFPWLVAEEGAILGYTYGRQFHERSAYCYSVETTIYCDYRFLNRGIGTRLYTKQLQKLRDQELKVAIGCIALPNEPCIRLHEKLGFQKVAHLSQVGFKMDKWVDVGYWELVLN